MAVFNSLGSNYNLEYVLKSLFGKSSLTDTVTLKKLLKEKYGGEVTLFYKGREALTFGLQTLQLPEDSQIAINGFTCVAVFNAIRKAGLEPACIDLQDSGGLNFTAESLEKEVTKNKKIKVVVVQNTLGYPCDIEGIQKVCKKNNLLLIEDLAHSVGTKYESGKEGGTVGDVVILSFSQDKIIDAVTGGAIVVRNKNLQGVSLSGATRSNPVSREVRDRIYPHLTYKIRYSYNFGLGKPYHFFLKRLKLVGNIMDESYYDYYSLPNRNAMLALYMFEKLDQQLAHRRTLAEIYVSSLPDSLFMFKKEKMRDAIKLSSNLRFPIFINDRTSLVNKFKKHNIFLSDIWYKDVAPECPNAVSDAKIILNLPTHINISEKDAVKICELINKWIQK